MKRPASRFTGRPSAYRRSLRDNPYWEKVKMAVRMRDGYKCVKCSKVGGYEVHHITYYSNGKSIVGTELEHLDCLVLLCSECHRNTHNK